MDLVNSDHLMVSGHSGQSSGHYSGGQFSGGQLVSGQRRRRATTSSNELYSIDDLPRVIRLNDSEVTRLSDSGV